MPSRQVMGKFSKGTLRSGSPSGPKVTNPKQAIAIMLSEEADEKRNGGTYPEKPRKPSIGRAIGRTLRKPS
jgi:hypothetical protein